VGAVSIRWKLFATYLAVLLVAVGALGLYLNREISRSHLDSLERSLSSQAELIRHIVARDFSSPQGRLALDDAARRLGRDTHLRITLIGRDGAVLGDSEHDIRTMDNHSSRPEVRQALSQGKGRSIRYSQTLGVDMLYLAVPVKSGSADVGVVRVAMPLHQVAAALGRIRSMVVTAALLALALALLLGVKMAGSIGRRIAAVSRAARALAGGDLEAQARLRGADEIAALATSFNEMARRLRLMVRELRQEKRRVETILERLGEAILVTDPTGRIALGNLAAEQLFGKQGEQLVGQSVVDATQNAALDAAFRQALATGGTTTAEVQVLFPRHRVLEATVTAISTEEPLGAVAVLHDVTDLRRLESVRREFVANASHELQTPITAIKAMAETLLGGAKDDPAVAERFLHDLENQADRLGALVRDLLDLATIEGGGLHLESAEANVSDIARSVIAQLRSLAQQRQVAVGLDLPEDLTALADWSALNRILANLLDNAIKYTEPGGRAGIRGARQHDRIVITVWDTGIGIPSTDLSRVFERFYRVDKARSRGLGGTGLGLSIVKHLVEALGGQIGVDSRLGKGSEFTVTLPAASAPPSPGDSAAAAH
jgi:two-component system phosphate regulon sensor histidine kinase PhoR